MGRFRSSVVVMLLAGLGFAGAPAVYPAAVEAATGAAACPVQGVPATAFTDTVRSTHRAAIDCAAWWGLTSGTTATVFGVSDPISRGQTAAMVARLLRNTGAATGSAPSAGFTDTAGHRFEQDIDLLVDLGIVTGLTPTTFGPDQPVLRAQMASIITHLFDEGYDAPLPAGSATFDDVEEDGVHREAISALASAGITTGITPRLFAPSRQVTRAEMASFLTRSAARLVSGGFASPPTTVPAPNDAFNSKTRGAWVNLFENTLKSRAGITRMLDELSAAGANLVVAQVVRRQDAYYESDVLPRTADPALPEGFDVLAELIPAAHARGIEVHAWYSVAPTWHGMYKDLPRPEGWIAAERGRFAPEADRWTTKRNDGTWSDYLDLGIPEVQEHVAAVVGEIATKYDVDGIHLDYTRYESPNHGYNPAALRRYYDSVGDTTWPAVDDPSWLDWRRSQTREVVRQARDAIAASGRDVELSAAVISWGSGPPTPDRAGFRRTAPYTRVLQDWDGWVRDGLLDAVMPMNYFREQDPSQARWFDEWLAYEARLTGDVGARVLPGPAAYMNSAAHTLDQVRSAVQRTNGAVLYSYHQPASDGTRGVLSQLAATRWGYSPANP